MTVQDDSREQELIALFQLEKPMNATRISTDAFLDLNGEKIPFELKSTTSNSVTTVRDFGREHIKKWQDKHWLFGFYETSRNTIQLKYCLYGSPQAMTPWIEEKEAYIIYDHRLSQLVPELLSIELLYDILGEKEYYTLEDAKKLQKRQYSIQEYQKRMDLEGGYSPRRMLSLLQERCRYLIERGSTLNNPHIPASYFNGWERITSNHAQRLREMVVESLKSR